MASRSPIAISFTGNVIIMQIDGLQVPMPESEFIRHKVTNINVVPVLAFEFRNPEDNFFFHLNFREMTSFTEWKTDGLIEGRLEFMDNNKLMRRLEFILSNDDSFDIKRSFLYQQGLSTEMIDASVEFIYDKPFTNYEWLR